MSKKILLILAALTVTSPLMAVSVQRVTVGNFDEFAQGEALSVALAQPGVLKPGVGLKEIFDLKDLNIWSGVADAGGDLYVGTGPNGEVFRIHDGAATQVAKFNESDVYTVARNAAGEIFAASSPKGKIYRFADGHAEEYFSTGEDYVWDMIFDADGNLFVATGGKGKIFKVSGKGKGEVYYASDEPNIRCLAFDKTGNLLAGTSGKGLLFRITDKNQAVVLLQAAYAEITALSVSGDTIYAAATGKRDIKSALRIESAITVSGTSGGEAVKAIAAALSARAAVSAMSAGASAQPAPSDKSVLYRLQRDLYPEIVARADSSIYALALTGQGVLLGTGGGKLYRLNKDEQLELIGKVEAKDITKLLAADGDRAIVLASNLAKGFTLSAGGGEGVYLSKVFDSGLFAQWGALEVSGSGKWQVQTRSGNTERPDQSWYPWAGLKQHHIASPSARYVQFKLTVSEGEIWRAEFAYLPQNQPPTLSVITVLAPGVGSREMPMPNTANAPRTANLDQLLKGGAMAQPVPQPQYQLANTPGLRTIAWRGSDPNGDQLRYKIEIRAEGQQDWDLLAEKLDKSIFSWDASGWADGNYYARVTVSDELDNAQGKSYTALRVSDVFQIDNTPPRITVLSKDDDFVEIRVTDALSLLGSAQISTNAQDYTEVQPKDGITDSRQEEYRLKRERGKPLYLRVTDAAGNVAGLRIEK